MVLFLHFYLYATYFDKDDSCTLIHDSWTLTEQSNQLVPWSSVCDTDYSMIHEERVVIRQILTIRKQTDKVTILQARWQELRFSSCEKKRRRRDRRKLLKTMITIMLVQRG